MAEAVLGPLVEIVLAEALTLAKEQISSVWGMKNDLRNLAKRLFMIQAMLSDAETKSSTNLSVKLWLQDLEDAAFDAICLLDEYGCYVLRKQIEKPWILKKVRRFFSTSNPIAFRFIMASKIKEINSLVDGIFKEAEWIGLVRNAMIINSSNIDVKKDQIITGPFVTTSEIIGRKNDAKTIVDELTYNQNDNLPVIGIVGMFGQGKTKLAQLVFNNKEVTRYFEKKIWVCVSDDFIVEKILNDMLKFLTGIVPRLNEGEQIVYKVKEELKEKRFLLVLDDVWNEDAQKWSNMMMCLQEIGGSKGSQIIVTTQNMKVISIMGPSLTQQLGELTKEESWELFEKKIVDELTSLPVIGIVGMAGQGKTTLAQLVFNNEEVTRSFEKKIWVCVSDDFIVEKILNDMLQSLTRKVSKLTTRQAIVDKLKEELNKKRFLLVLDDVWNEIAQKWSDMMTSLQEIGGSKGSKIIVTTRNMQVINSIMTPSFPHQLGALTNEDSWELFQKIAFADGEATTTKDLMDVGKKVVQKCGGLPLAIKALAALMKYKRNAGEWSKIVESNIWNSIDPQSSIMPIVKLSYDNLPSLSLKQCFVYCSIFPKDSIIEKEMLIQQWMAHGLLNPSQGSKLEMEDIGNNCFQILLQRSLFQDVTFDECGNINSCKMHDVVHDFASQASKDRCLIIDDGVQIQDTNNAQHWCISDNRSKGIDTTIPFRLRTLFLFNAKIFSFGQLAECKCLCVLVLRDIDGMLMRLPSSIAKMKYLRNLDISRTSIQRLPNSITKLYNLQTLRVGRLREFPRDFGSLVKLRHLHISAVRGISFPLGISKMTSLRTLSSFVVSRTCQIKELKSLNNLEGELGIYDLQNVSNREEAMKADLSKKGNILDLELHWPVIPYDKCGDNNHENVLEGLKPHSNLKCLKIRGFAGKNLPPWIQLLDKLVKIELSCLSGCDQITALGQFPCLKVVKIEAMTSLMCIGNEFYGVTSSPWSRSFPSLTQLYLGFMWSLEKWSDPIFITYGDESNIHHGNYRVVFPVLEVLEIRWVPKLKQLPNVLNRRIPFLKKLKLDGTGLRN